MAETVAWLADSGRTARKVIVWLHNDHARYRSWRAPAGLVPAAGGLLQEAFPGNVLSVGFYMGTGTVGNNARRLQSLAPLLVDDLAFDLRNPGPGPRYQPLRGPTAPAWAAHPRSYRRNGVTADTLTPAAEFDGLIYLDTVTAATYVKR